MKKIIIRYRNFILKVHISKDNTTIIDSFKVKNPSDMRSVIYLIRNKAPEGYAIDKRRISSMVHEWRVHNLLYNLGIFKNRTKDVDFESNQSWYIKVLYYILSPFYLHF